MHPFGTASETEDLPLDLDDLEQHGGIGHEPAPPASAPPAFVRPGLTPLAASTAQPQLPAKDDTLREPSQPQPEATPKRSVLGALAGVGSGVAKGIAKGVSSGVTSGVSGIAKGVSSGVTSGVSGIAKGLQVGSKGLQLASKALETNTFVNVDILQPGLLGFFFEETSQHYPPLRLSCLVEGSQATGPLDTLFSGMAIFAVQQIDHQGKNTSRARGSKALLAGGPANSGRREAAKWTQAQLARALLDLGRPIRITFSKASVDTRPLPVLSFAQAMSEFGGVTLDSEMRGLERWNTLAVRTKETTHLREVNHLGDLATSAKALDMLLKMKRKDVQRRKLLQRRTFTHKALLRWKGTILPNVLQSPHFLLSSALYFLVVFSHKFEWFVMPDIGPISSYLGPITGFIMFFSVFYNNQCYTRWVAQYAVVNACRKDILLVSSLLCAYVPGSEEGTTGRVRREAAKLRTVGQIIGYLNAAQIATFVGLTCTYEQFFFKVLVNKFQLLTPQEMNSILAMDLDSDSGASVRELIRMALSRLITFERRKIICGVQYNAIQMSICSLQDHLTALFIFDNQPIPFGYYNMLSWLLVFYLPLSSFMYGQANYERWYWAMVPVFFVNICLLGLNSLALKFSTPFGDAIECFAVNHYLETTCYSSRELLDNVVHSAAAVNIQSHARGHLARSKFKLGIRSGLKAKA